jgi:hypothetical protein
MGEDNGGTPPDAVPSAVASPFKSCPRDGPGETVVGIGMP